MRFSSSYFSLKKLKINEPCEIMLGLAFKSVLRINYLVSFESIPCRRRSSSTDEIKKFQMQFDKSSPIYKEIMQNDKEKAIIDIKKKIANDDAKKYNSSQITPLVNPNESKNDSKDSFNSPTKERGSTKPTLNLKSKFSGVVASSNKEVYSITKLEKAGPHKDSNPINNLSKEKISPVKINFSSKTPIAENPSDPSLNKSLQMTNLEYETCKIFDDEEQKILKNKFCAAFFVSSIPFANASIYEKTENLLAECEHKECGLVPAYVPEILYSFSRLNEKELNVSNEVRYLLTIVCKVLFS